MSTDSLTINEYNIDSDAFSLLLPKDAKILCVQVKNNIPKMWVCFSSKKDKIARRFCVKSFSKNFSKANIREYIETYELDGGK